MQPWEKFVAGEDIGLSGGMAGAYFILFVNKCLENVYILFLYLKSWRLSFMVDLVFRCFSS